MDLARHSDGRSDAPAYADGLPQSLPLDNQRPPLHMPRNIDGRFPCAPRCGACLRQLVPISQFDCPELNNWVPLRLALHEADGVRHVETLRPGEEVAMEILRRVISGDQ